MAKTEVDLVDFDSSDGKSCLSYSKMVAGEYGFSSLKSKRSISSSELFAEEEGFESAVGLIGDAKDAIVMDVVGVVASVAYDFEVDTEEEVVILGCLSGVQMIEFELL